MNKQTVITAFLTLIVGTCLGFLLFNASEDRPENTPKEKKIAYWVAPMDANYRRDAPGKSPMGMDLIPVYETDDNPAAADQPGFTIAAHVQANLGIKTAPVIQADFTPVIQATGRLAYDQRKISHIQIRAEGWVEKLYVRAEGEKVKKGDRLLAFYSPDIAAALGEYYTARQGNSTGLKKLTKARLFAFGLSEKTIEQALNAGNWDNGIWHEALIIYAPQDGVISRLGVREGSILAKNTVAFEITDPANLWVIADVYESDGPGLDQNSPAEIILQDGTIYRAMIDHIYPGLDPLTRTIQIRFNLPNSSGKFRPGQFFAVNILGQPEVSLVIPTTAVIRLGTGNHVMIAHGQGRFEAAKVTLGASSGQKIQIRQGLKEGEEVVISGQFMLDSESSFAGAKLRILPSDSSQMGGDKP